MGADSDGNVTDELAPVTPVRHLAALAAALLGLVLVACGDSETGEGGGRGAVIDTASCPSDATETIEGDTIKVGSATPLSGQYAVFGAAGRAAEAYYEMVNADGGVQTVDGKKKIDFILTDNQYSPSETQSEVRELVERERVAIVGNLLGSAPTVAVSPFLNQRCIPLMWALSGAKESLGSRFPFNTQYTSTVDSGTVIGKSIRQDYRDASVAVLYQNDDVGESLRTGLRIGLRGSGVEVVEEQSYETTDTDVRDQMTTLAASDADVLVAAAAGPKCTQALDALDASNWRPKAFYMMDACQAPEIAIGAHPDGVTLMQPRLFKPLGIDDPAIEKFETTLGQAGVDANATSLTGWATAQLLVETLVSADEWTRIGLAEAARDLSELPPSFREGLAAARGAQIPTREYEVATWDEALKQFGEGGTKISAAG